MIETSGKLDTLSCNSDRQLAARRKSNRLLIYGFVRLHGSDERTGYIKPSGYTFFTCAHLSRALRLTSARDPSALWKRFI